MSPNPAKIAILLEELNIGYEVINRKFLDSGPEGTKSQQYLKINPTGMVPAIIDHANGDHIVWESAAILTYLVERFDPNGGFLGTTIEERSTVSQWVNYQVTSLGPMQLEHAWYKFFHDVKDVHPSVKDRYKNGIIAIWTVLENRLATSD